MMYFWNEVSSELDLRLFIHLLTSTSTFWKLLLMSLEHELKTSMTLARIMLASSMLSGNIVPVFRVRFPSIVSSALYAESLSVDWATERNVFITSCKDMSCRRIRGRRCSYRAMLTIPRKVSNVD